MLPDLESLQCFVEAASVLNFRAAARAVDITPAAFGQRIKSLEGQLGVSLFHRTTRRVTLTEAGTALLPVALRTLEVARSCAPAARGELGPTDVDLTVGTRHELGLSWIEPMLPRLQSALPGLTVHLYFGSGPDLELRVRSHEIDCAVTSRRISDPKLEGLRLHQEEYVFVGSPRLLHQRPFEEPEDAARHTLVDTNAELPLYHYWREAGGPPSVAYARVRRMGTVAAVQQLVLRGEGVAVLPRYLVDADLTEDRLLIILPEVVPPPDWFRLVFRSDDPRRPLLQKVAEQMRQQPVA